MLPWIDLFLGLRLRHVKENPWIAAVLKDVRNIE
jgi:hypothetical protein